MRTGKDTIMVQIPVCENTREVLRPQQSAEDLQEALGLGMGSHYFSNWP